jgi:tRNA A37 N6-isopentenylltransferase MiaA
MCDDFTNVCICAELEPEIVKEAYVKALKDKNVRFTKRQLMWLKYNKLYNRMKDLPDKQKQKMTRKRVNALREEVFSTSTEYVSTVFLSVLA